MRMRQRYADDEVTSYLRVMRENWIRYKVCWLAIFLMSSKIGFSQSDPAPFRIGVVLSGGGAKGAAHVGFLQALEDAGIVPDCIVGASVGALVGSYYAAGWSPSEMNVLLSSEAFKMRLAGEAPWEFGFKEWSANPSLIQIKLASGGGLVKGNLISGLPIDWALMEELGPAEADAKSQFDQLFIPFRCVASDVVMKRDTVFSSGNLATAVRASVAFPFYLKPIWLDGKPHYDGGLYNNFPIDVLEREFQPDFMIGCSVADEIIAMESDDLAVQLEAMISRPPKSYETNDHIAVVQPDLELGTFDFDRSNDAVLAGFEATQAMIPHILSQLTALGWEPDSMGQEGRRLAYKENLPAFQIDTVVLKGLKPNQQKYVESSVLGRVASERTRSVKRNLFLLESDEHIGDLRPEASYNAATGFFDVEVDVKEERDLGLEAGGNISSLPVSFGFASARYSRFGRVPMSFKFATSFGSLYSSALLAGRFDFHGAVPWAVQPYYLLHRWNYVRSFSTFFQDVRPSFLLANEVEFGLRFLIPTGNRSVLELHQVRLKTADFTYPNWEFNPADTTDVERFNGWVIGIDWIQNSLDSKQFPREGSSRSLRIKRFDGINEAVYEDANPFFSRVDTSSVQVGFYRLAADFEQYVSVKKKLSLGVKIAARLSDEGVRSTYRSSLIQATPMEPMPGAKSLFLENYRSFNFIGLGAVVDIQLGETMFRWRTEYHGMFLLDRLKDSAKGPIIVSRNSRRYMAGSWLVCDTQAGLFSFGAEYFPEERSPLLVEFSWGYRLFQSSMRR